MGIDAREAAKKLGGTSWMVAKVVSSKEFRATLSEVKYQWNCHDLLDALHIVDYLDFIEMARYRKETKNNSYIS